MPEFFVSQEVYQKFAGLHIAVVEGSCSENKFSDEKAFLQEKKIAEENARKIVLAEHPNIAAWRKTFHAFGADPTKTRSSGEALLRRVQRGDSLPSINAVVDVYNLISLKHTLPIGGQDEEKIFGNVFLRIAGENEKFVPLGASEPARIDVGEVVYADGEKILCSKWNYRDCEPAKISGETKKFVLFIDGCSGIEKERVENAAKELIAMLNKHVGGCGARAAMK